MNTHIYFSAASRSTESEGTQNSPIIGAIIGILIFLILVAVVTILLAVLFARKRRKQGKATVTFTKKGLINPLSKSSKVKV